MGVLYPDLLQVGQEIDSGAPALYHRDKIQLSIALKSANFGGSKFFLHALNFLASEIKCDIKLLAGKTPFNPHRTNRGRMLLRPVYSQL